jgi:hypothetical protein
MSEHEKYLDASVRVAVYAEAYFKAPKREEKNALAALEKVSKEWSAIAKAYLGH